MDPKTSRRIFELARDQQDELEMADEEEEDAQPSASTRPRLDDDDDDDDSELGDVEDEDVEEIFVSYHFSRKDVSLMVLQEIDEGDMETLDALHPHNAGERRTLADIIFAKLESGETENAAVIKKVQQGSHRLVFPSGQLLTRATDREKPDPALGLDPKVVTSYAKYAFSLQAGL